MIVHNETVGMNWTRGKSVFAGVCTECILSVFGMIRLVYKFHDILDKRRAIV